MLSANKPIKEYNLWDGLEDIEASAEIMGEKRKRQNPKDRNKFANIGVEGRKTGIKAPENLPRDEHGLQDVEEYFKSDEENESEDEPEENENESEVVANNDKSDDDLPLGDSYDETQAESDDYERIPNSFPTSPILKQTTAPTDLTDAQTSAFKTPHKGDILTSAKKTPATALRSANQNRRIREVDDDFVKAIVKRTPARPLREVIPSSSDIEEQNNQEQLPEQFENAYDDSEINEEKQPSAGPADNTEHKEGVAIRKSLNRHESIVFDEGNTQSDSEEEQQEEEDEEEEIPRAAEDSDAEGDKQAASSMDLDQDERHDSTEVSNEISAEYDDGGVPDYGYDDYEPTQVDEVDINEPNEKENEAESDSESEQEHDESEHEAENSANEESETEQPEVAMRGGNKDKVVSRVANKSKPKAAPKPKSKLVARYQSKRTYDDSDAENQHEDEDDEDDDGTRRSKRRRIKPLEWWRNEKQVYVRKAINAPTGKTFVTTVKEVVYAPPPSPPTTLGRRQPHHPTLQSKLKKHNLSEKPNPDVPVINYTDGTEKMTRVTVTPDYLDPKLVKGQGFYFQKLFSEGEFLNSGVIELPKDGKKENRSSHDNAFIFTVVSGTIKATVHKTTFVVKTGSQFYVPRGNQYSIDNLGNSKARIYFVSAKEVKPSSLSSSSSAVTKAAAVTKVAPKKSEKVNRNVPPKSTKGYNKGKGKTVRRRVQSDDSDDSDDSSE